MFVRDQSIINKKSSSLNWYNRQPIFVGLKKQELWFYNDKMYDWDLEALKWCNIVLVNSY